jgi:Flp pilus assembly pilin Flp
MLRRLWSWLCRDDQGQDLTEYALLIAFVALASVGLYASAGDNAANIWDGAGDRLAAANSTAGGSSGSANTATSNTRPRHHHH